MDMVAPRLYAVYIDVRFDYGLDLLQLILVCLHSTCNYPQSEHWSISAFLQSENGFTWELINIIWVCSTVADYADGLLDRTCSFHFCCHGRLFPEHLEIGNLFPIVPVHDVSVYYLYRKVQY